MKRYYALVCGFDGRHIHLNFQIAYHEKYKCVKTKYWGLRIEPSWPPVVLLKGELPSETKEE